MKRALTVMVSILLLNFLVSCSDDDGASADATVPDAGMDLDREDMSQDGEASDTAPEDLITQPDQTVDASNPSAWTEVLSGTSGDLNEVWGPAADNVFAVGKGGLIMNYDGTSWITMNNPFKGDLNGVDGNDQYVFAVGSDGDLYYEGTAWQQGYSYSSEHYYDVWVGDTNVIAVGSLNGSIDYKALADPEDWWSSVWDASGGSEIMYGIWGMSENEVYVVGEGGLILKCASSCANSDSTWTKMITGVNSDLYDIWGTASDDIFAVGNDGVILHYDGTDWSKMTVNTSSYFRGVWGSSATDVFVVGHPIFEEDESVFRYDGTSWTKMPLPKTSFLNGVWGFSNTDVWVVGKTNILHYDGSKP